MRLRHQLALAVVLLLATAAAIRQIAQSRNEAAAGALVYRLDERHPEELDAFAALRGGLAMMGQRELADRLEALRRQGALWIAPELGAGRWAIFVDTGSLVRRIYIRRLALLEPRAHLYPEGDAAISRARQDAFGQIGRAGALYHELLHYDGVEQEGAAYDSEIAWYQSLRRSPWYAGLEQGQRPIYDWALESAVLSAQEARRRALS